MISFNKADFVNKVLNELYEGVPPFSVPETERISAFLSSYATRYRLPGTWYLSRKSLTEVKATRHCGEVLHTFVFARGDDGQILVQKTVKGVTEEFPLPTLALSFYKDWSTAGFV